MEVRPWMLEAMKWGAMIYPDMVAGNVYLYQLYTMCFVGFKSKDVAEAFVDWAEKNIDHWGYDPITLIDTNDEATRELWKVHIKKQTPEQKKVGEDGAVGLEYAVSKLHAFLESGYEVNQRPGQTWWLRSPDGGYKPVSRADREIAIIVKDGRVADVYATWKEDLSIEVVDLDVNGDEEREAEVMDCMKEIEAKVESRTLFKIY